jgi:hypothetical protein
MAGQKNTARMTALMTKKAIQGHAVRGGRVTAGRGSVSGERDIVFDFLSRRSVSQRKKGGAEAASRKYAVLLKQTDAECFAPASRLTARFHISSP